MSYPYYLDLVYGNEKSVVDSIFHITLGSSEPIGPDKCLLLFSGIQEFRL